MKILLSDTQETINISSITPEHVVVFLMGEKFPFILVAGNSISKNGYKFIRLIRPQARRQVGIYPAQTIQGCIRQAIEYGRDVRAFANWKEAFKWLLAATE